MAIHYTQNLKENAVVYYNDHKDLGMNGCAKNLGISKSALSNWVNAAKEQGGKVPIRGAGNQHSGKMTEAIYYDYSYLPRWNLF